MARSSELSRRKALVVGALPLMLPLGGCGGTMSSAKGGAGGNASGGDVPDAGNAGSGGTGGAAPDAVADFGPGDVRIEAGSPPGMVDGATMSCGRTAPDQLGPYHLADMPERVMQASASDGMILVVTGRILDTRCRPLANVVMDVWNANGAGVYSETAGGWCRGKVRTDANGQYKYDTVYPGPYQGRPRHIHLLVAPAGYTPLVTQMYFQNERPDIPANAVPRAMVNGVWQSRFDIVLAGTGMASAAPARPTIAQRLAMRRSPKPEQETSWAPSMRRAKS